MIDWNSDETYWMVNPSLSEREQKAVRAAREKAPELEGHIWIRSSGTTTADSARWVALSKAAFLVSAAAVNDHLASTHLDTWVRALPVFHVGGLSIDARAHLSGARVLEWDQPWDPGVFCEYLVDQGATLLSLVPTQLYDIVSAGLTAPVDLRAVIVGGAALEEDLYFKARELRWPVLPSYGMTEAASQVATASIDSLTSNEYPPLQVLNHIQPKIDEEGHFSLLSSCLMTMALLVDLNDGQVQLAVRDPSHYFPTQDLVHIENGQLKFLGRSSQMVKVLGEQVSLRKLNQMISRQFYGHSLSPHSFIILPVNDARKGVDLVLATDSPHMQLVEKAVEGFHQFCEKYERLSGIYFVRQLSRTELKKIRVSETMKALGLV